jgi:hypothetical protein
MSVLTRTLREGLVLRALIWPALIIALTLLVSATFVAGLYASKSAAVPDEALAEVLVAKGLDARVYADPEAAFVAGEVDRAAFEGAEGWVLLARFDGAYTTIDGVGAARAARRGVAADAHPPGRAKRRVGADDAAARRAARRAVCALRRGLRRRVGSAGIYKTAASTPSAPCLCRAGFTPRHEWARRASP